ncbi:hypothetical protein [Telluribacter humicola]|uniref:hypothetical protein n=1 Tax=Telluribacter humicola TaxID=1720261 RepID=UPI001A9571CA|nr:hypothetical protein [Telluribacter humicola]
MKQITVYTFWIGLAMILTQCVSSQPTTTTSKGGSTARTAATTNDLENGCPLDKMNWLVVGKEFNEAELAQLANRLSDAARSDAQQLNEMIARGDASPLAITSSLKSIVEGASQSKMQVNDEFYKEYVSNRMAICSILDALRKGSIKKDESVKATENAFRNVAQSFDELSKNLKEKAARKAAGN